MENYPSKNNRNLSRILRLRWIWAVGGLGILLALILISIPWGMGYGIERYFLANGADQVNVEDIDFNPFTRRLVVKNLIVYVDNEKVLNISEARFALAWFPFFNKRFILEKVELTDSTAVMEELPDGRWRVGGFLPTPSESQPSALTWGFGISELQIRFSRLKFNSPKLTSELRIDQAQLTRLRSCSSAISRRRIQHRSNSYTQWKRTIQPYFN